MNTKIKLRNIFNWLVLFILLEPPIFTLVNTYATIDRFYDICRVLLILGISIHVLKSSVRLKMILPFAKVLSMVWIIQIVSTVINMGNLFSTILSYLTVLSLCMWFDLQVKSDWFGTAKIVTLFLSFLTTMNLITQIRYPFGLYSGLGWRDEATYWLYGTTNSMPAIVIPTIVFCFLVFLHTKNVLYLVFMSIGVASLIECHSSTGLVGMLVFLSLQVILLIRLKYYHTLPNSKIFNINVYIVAAFSVAVLFIVVNEISAFSYIIVDLLNKDLTLTSRTSIWSRFLAEILEKPVIGYGVKYVADVRSQFNTSHQHDYYLHLMYQGGFLCLIAFFNMINKCRQQLIASANKMDAFVLSAGLFSFFLMFITEVYGDTLHIFPFYLLILFIYNVKYDNGISV